MTTLVAWSGEWGDQGSEDLIHALKSASRGSRLGWGLVVRTPTIWITDSDLSDRFDETLLRADLDRIAADNVDTLPTGVLVYLSDARLTPGVIQPCLFDGDGGRLTVAHNGKRRDHRHLFECKVYKRFTNGMSVVDALTSTIADDHAKHGNRAAIVMTPTDFVFASIETPLYIAGDVTIASVAWNGPREPMLVEAE